MEIETIRQIFIKEVKRKGYNIEENKSLSTNSWYFTLSSGKYSMVIRVSDHNSKKDISTLRIDKIKKTKNVESYIHNRCQDLHERKMKAILGY